MDELTKAIIELQKVAYSLGMHVVMDDTQIRLPIIPDAVDYVELAKAGVAVDAKRAEVIVEDIEGAGIFGTTLFI